MSYPINVRCVDFEMLRSCGDRAPAARASVFPILSVWGQLIIWIQCRLRGGALPPRSLKDAERPLVIIRSNFIIKPALKRVQEAKRICMGNWALKNLADLFLGPRKSFSVPSLPSAGITNVLGKKGPTQKTLSGVKNKIKTCLGNITMIRLMEYTLPHAYHAKSPRTGSKSCPELARLAKSLQKSH